MELSSLPGVGPKRAATLADMGLRTTEDAAWHLPRRYETIAPWDGTSEGPFAVAAVLRSARRVAKGRVEGRLESAHGPLRARFYGRPLASVVRMKDTMRVWYGPVRRHGSAFHIEGPEIVSPDEVGMIRPVYPLAGGVGQGLMRQVVGRSLDLVAAHPLAEAFRWVHRPRSMADVPRGLAELKRAEARALAGGLAGSEESVSARPYADRQVQIGGLAFTLREDQSRALLEIRRDLARATAMRRLLFGEVGSGKTVVALLAAAGVLAAGDGVVFLCPTALLAHQHAESARALFGGSVPVLIQAGSLRPTALPGGAFLLVGTTGALELEGLAGRIGLVIVDEEQRFGVRQREALLNQDPAPHLLTLSATPIPRSLAGALTGLLAISRLRSREVALAPVRVIGPRERRAAYLTAFDAYRQGRQAIVICPRREEGDPMKVPPAEGLATSLRRAYPSVPITVVTGGPGREAQEERLKPFHAGKPGWLVGTSILEVGLDLPAADVLVVEGAQAFGLSQLHQMRGRVGRHATGAVAFWIADAGDEEGRRRLEEAAAARSGEDVALLDLATRGPGVLEGWLQHGFPPLRALAFPEDLPILVEAFTERSAKDGL